MHMWDVTVPSARPCCAMPRSGLAELGADSWGRPTFHCTRCFERQWFWFLFFCFASFEVTLQRGRDTHRARGGAGRGDTRRRCRIGTGETRAGGTHELLPTECTKAVVPPNPSTGRSGAASLKWRRRGRKKTTTKHTMSTWQPCPPCAGCFWSHPPAECHPAAGKG